MNKIYMYFIIIVAITGFSLLSAHPKLLSSIESESGVNITARADSAHGFDVTKYQINLKINDQTHYISGTVLADVTAMQNLSGIDYNLIGLTVSDVKVNDITTTYTQQNGILHINLTAGQGEAFTTKVTYSGNPQLSPTPYNIGIIFSSNTVFTLSDPDAGRYWWPCYDHPWDKAIVDLHVTMRSDWLVACNGLRSSIVDNGDGTKTHNWLGSNPMATYLVCFTAGPYQEINQTAGSIPIQNFVTAGQYNNAMTDFSTLPSILQFFETQFGPYPFEKYGNAVVSMTTYGAMEHQTMTTLGQQYITGNHSGELTIAHELAHQWFGDCLTILTFKDVWLSEGFATYSELLWTHKKNGWQAACNYANNSYHQYYNSWESSVGPQTIYNPAFNNYFNPQSYEKAASVLHMLRLKIGNENFFQLLRTWFSTYHNSNVITSEFQALAEQISGQDLAQFFSQWIYHAGIPTIECTFLSNPDTWQARINGKTISNTQTPFYMEVPIKVTNFAEGDSIVFQATPGTGASNLFSLSDVTSPYAVLGVDANHWTLNRGITIKDVVLNQCLASNQTVLLSWDDFSDMIHFAGYHVYRRVSGQTEYLRLTENPVTTTSYVDNTVENGVQYYYKIKAVDFWNFQTLGSNEMSASPLSFPFDWGILVVDETKDGNGVTISPTDAMVDTFYSEALSPIQFAGWDYFSLGAPTLSTLSHYPIILWHADDFGQNLISTNLDNLGSYVLGGGKLIISGWKTPGSFTTAFINTFMQGVTLNYFNASVLVSAQSTLYPVLMPDSNHLTATWSGVLPMVYTFQNAQNALYTASMVPNTTGQGEPLVARFDNNGTLIVLGFPLYCMQQEGVRAFLQQLIHELDPTQAADDNTGIMVKQKMTCYPNPFSDELNISFNQKINPDVSINLYNIKGQYINTIAPEVNKTGDNSLKWIPRDANGQNLPAGIYLLRYQNGRTQISEKLILMR